MNNFCESDWLKQFRGCVFDDVCAFELYLICNKLKTVYFDPLLFYLKV